MRIAAKHLKDARASLAGQLYAVFAAMPYAKDDDCPLGLDDVSEDISASAERDEPFSTVRLDAILSRARRVLAGGKIPQPSRCVFMRYRFASRSVSSQAFGILALFPFETFLAIQKVPDRRPDERVRWTPPKLAQSL